MSKFRTQITNRLARRRGSQNKAQRNRRLGLEPLEDRLMLAFVWANRGDASDNFDAAFGASAEVARNVVDSAINEWNRVVTGYQGQDFDVQMTIFMDPDDPATSAFASGTVRDDNGVPISGNVEINMALDEEGNSKWYLDPTPDDHSEFMGSIVNAFARNPTEGGPADGKRDLRTLLIHELGHTMGVSSGSPLMYSNPAITMTNTGIPDTSVGDEDADNSYWLFQGPSVNAVMTDFDIGGDNVSASAGHAAMPLAGNTPINFGGQLYYTSVDTMQPTSLSIRRILLTNKTALMMNDMGYDVVMPETFGTFHSVLNGASGLLTIQGGNDNTLINNVDQGASSDTITLLRFGSLVALSIDIGVDVPGTGPGMTAQDQQGAFFSVFNVSDISSIRIEGFDGNDEINLIGDFDFLSTLQVFGGDGNDDISGAALTGSQALLAFGEGGNDSLVGGPAADRLVGGGGADSLIGGDGNDQLIGGFQIDSLNSPDSDSSADTLNGGAGDDGIIADDGSFFPLIVRETIGGNDVVQGGNGDDLIFGGFGNDDVYGQGGDDTIAAGPGNDTVLGGWFLFMGAPPLTDGDDFINGQDGDDVIYGDNLDPTLPPTFSLNGGNDELLGGNGDDTIVGQAGHDELGGGQGDDTLHGGVGNDQLTGGPDADLLVGDIGTDLLFGNEGPDSLDGGADDDILVGGSGGDEILGGSGDDVLTGESGDDLLVGGFGSDTLDGGADNDGLIGGNLGGLGVQADVSDDSLNGGDGHDVILGDSGSINPFFTPVLDFLGGDDTIQGGDGNDAIYGQAGADFIGGWLGNDLIFGGLGNDIASGDDGDDIVSGESGDDIVAGGAGNDTVTGGSGNDIVVGGVFSAGANVAAETGDDLLAGGDGDDLLLGDSWAFGAPLDFGVVGGNDTIGGGPGNDLAVGQSGNDLLFGDAGNDTLLGADGNDRIRGGDGNDQLGGGAGHDLLLGENGNDALTGGNGRDILIGGLNADTLDGGADDDLLIAGTTAYDADDAALNQILAEWTSARSYQSRVKNIKGIGNGNPEFANRLNGTVFLKKHGNKHDGVATVFDDVDRDELTGSTGDDWFLFEPAQDELEDWVAGEDRN